MKRAVFFDRDGTLIEDVGYLTAPDQVRVRPGAAQAVRRLNEAGFLVVVVSNQSGVARGLMSAEDVERANDRLRELLGEQGARIDASYYCPHLPTGTVPAYAKGCECRKPKPGLLYQAARDLGIDLTDSFLVGDAARDVEAGRAARCQTIFLGDLDLLDAGARGQLEAFADFTATSLTEAANHILSLVSAELLEPEGPQGPPGDDTPQHVTQSEETTPMGPEQQTPAAERTCSRCGRAITEEELQEGAALARRGRHLCPACVGELQLRRGASPEDTGVDSQSILEELRNITRALTFESFSVMNVLGGVVQVATLGCLFKAYQLGGGRADSVWMLLWAIALQLLALTCFTLGRR